MDSRYSYDEEQQVWPFFAVTVLGCVLIPVTISQVLGLFSKKHVTVPKGYSSKLLAYDAKKRRGGSALIFVALGWLLMAILVAKIRGIEYETIDGAFDPWALLDIGASATEKEIKSAYRKLSLKLHPDKVRDSDLSAEEIEERYVLITKAYKSLTDEVTRENFLKYGHPDGPQAQMMGIALPKFLVEGGTPLLAAVYLLIGIGAPLLAARWWRIQSSKNSQGLLQSSATAFFLMCSQEQLLFLGTDDILERVAECDDFKDGRTPQERLKLLKARFTSREDTDPNLVATAVKLLDGLHRISFEFKNFEFCRRVTELERCLVVGVDPKKVAKGAELQEPVGSGKYVLPKLHVLDASFKVPGLEVVPPGSIPHLVLRFLVVPPGATEIPVIDKEIIEDAPTDFNVKLLRDPLSTNKLSPQLPPTQSPYFPVSEQFIPKWNAYLYGDMERIMSQPVALENLDLSNLSLTPEQFASGDGVVVSSFKIILGGPLPNQLAKIPLKLALLNTGYFGIDVRQRVIIETKYPPAQAPDDSQEEDKEEEREDDEEEEESDLSDIDTDTEDEKE